MSPTDPTPDDHASEASAEDGSDKPTAKASKDSVDDLTPEEQMARYEESLKDEDWGHQPC